MSEQHSRSVNSIPVRVNAYLCISAVGLHIFSFGLIPGLLLPIAQEYGFLLLPFVLLTNSYWALIHEGLHGHLHSHRGINEVCTRLLCVLYGAPMRILRSGHMLHHRFSRTESECLELYDRSAASRLAVTLDYYFQILGGLYLLEMLSGVLFCIPRPLLERMAKALDGPGRLTARTIRRSIGGGGQAEIRCDVFAISVFFGASAWLYGANVWMLCLALVGRGLLVSVSDYAYHYGTGLPGPRHGHNAWIPLWLQHMLLNFNLHGVHHRHPSLPWNYLSTRLLECGGYTAPLDRLVLRQFRGPIPHRDGEVHDVHTKVTENGLASPAQDGR